MASSLGLRAQAFQCHATFVWTMFAWSSCVRFEFTWSSLHDARDRMVMMARGECEIEKQIGNRFPKQRVANTKQQVMIPKQTVMVMFVVCISCNVLCVFF